MIIYSKCLLGKLCINFQVANVGIRSCDIYQLISQVAIKHSKFRHTITMDNIHSVRTSHQVPVEIRCHWISLRNSYCCSPLAIGTHNDVICLIQDGEKQLAFILVIRPVHIKIQIGAVNSRIFIKGVPPTQIQRDDDIPDSFHGYPGAIKCNGSVPLFQ